MGVEYDLDSTLYDQYEHDAWRESMEFIDQDFSCKKSINTRPKSIQTWNTAHLMSWIIDVCGKHNIDYEDLNITLLSGFNGSTLDRIDLDICRQVTPADADILYEEIQQLYKRPFLEDRNNSLFPCGIDDTYNSSASLDTVCARRDSLNSISDNEYPQVPPKRNRGRPRKTIAKRKEPKTGKLWEFLRDLLKDPRYCPNWICWENHDEGVFKFISSDKVAKLWGSKRGNDNMNYEKLSRAMRYYYKTKVLQPVLGKRLVYKFGPSAKNWRTPNPNFSNQELF